MVASQQPAPMTLERYAVALGFAEREVMRLMEALREVRATLSSYRVDTQTRRAVKCAGDDNCDRCASRRIIDVALATPLGAPGKSEK